VTWVATSWYFGKLHTKKDGVICYQLGQHANMFIGGSTWLLASTIALTSQSS